LGRCPHPDQYTSNGAGNFTKNRESADETGACFRNAPQLILPTPTGADRQARAFGIPKGLWNNTALLSEYPEGITK